MKSLSRYLALVLALVLVVAACGGDDDAAETTAAADAAETPTTASAPSTTVAPETTTTSAPTTTTAAPTTTTSAETATTAGASGGNAEADAMAMAKTDAAAAVTPDDWTNEVTYNDFVGAETDDFFSECSDPGDFDLANLDSVSLAIATLQSTAPVDPTNPFGSASASLEARVFESEAVASEAFVVLEKTLGSAEGRDCMGAVFTEQIGADLPADAEFSFSFDELDVPNADVGARLGFAITLEGTSFSFTFDLVATLQGDCTIYSAFTGFGEEFPADIRDAMIEAAVSA